MNFIIGELLDCNEPRHLVNNQVMINLPLADNNTLRHNKNCSWKSKFNAITRHDVTISITIYELKTT